MKNRKTLALRASTAALLLAAGSASSCATPPAPGEVMMIVHTDMSLPKDVDTVIIEVLVRGDHRFNQTYDRLGDSEFKIPASLGITIDADSDPTTPVTLRVTAKQKGKARVLHEAVTTVPEDRVAALRLPIHWLCWDELEVDADGNATSTCPDGQTCVAGSCVDKKIDLSKLPTYDPADVFGGGTGKDNTGSCFDVSSCFTGSVDAPVDMGTCTIHPTGDVNVGIRVESAGICGPAGCFVALDANAEAGWQSNDDGTIQLPPAVCDRIAEGKASGISVAGVSSACPLKTDGLPTCGPWSSAGTAPPAPGTETPVAIVANQDHPSSLAVAGGNVYWINSGPSGEATGTLKRVAVTGGPTTLLQSMLAFPKGLTLDVSTADKVIGAYWATNGVGSAGAVAGLDLTTPSAPKPITLAVAGVVSPEGVALQGGSLFFTDFGGNAVYSLDLESKTSSLLAGPGNGAAQSGAYRVAADAARVYWTNEAMPGTVVMVDRADPVPIVIADNQGTPRHLALDGAPATALFWTNYTSGEVMKAPITGGTPPTAGAPVALFTGQSKPYGIVVDGDTVYWTNSGDGTVMKAPKSGGTPEKIAADQHAPGAVAVDEDNVYWINEGSLTKADGAVMRLAKPKP